MTKHDEWCDGFMTLHMTESKRVSREGRGMFQALCRCGWVSGLYGPDGRIPIPDAHKWAEGPCDGRCVHHD